MSDTITPDPGLHFEWCLSCKAYRRYGSHANPEIAVCLSCGGTDFGAPPGLITERSGRTERREAPPGPRPPWQPDRWDVWVGYGEARPEDATNYDVDAKLAVGIDPPEGFTPAGPWRVRCNDGRTLVWERPLVRATVDHSRTPSAGSFWDYVHHMSDLSAMETDCGEDGTIDIPDRPGDKPWSRFWVNVNCPRCLLRQPRQP